MMTFTHRDGSFAYATDRIFRSDDAIDDGVHAESAWLGMNLEDVVVLQFQEGSRSAECHAMGHRAADYRRLKPWPVFEDIIHRHRLS
jgi:hypothetical protein